MISNEPTKPKRTPLGKRIKQVFVKGKGQNMHHMYPELYYCAYWLSHRHNDMVEFIAKAKGITKKAAAEEMIEEGLRQFMHEHMMKSISDPQSQAEIAAATRLRLALRWLAKQKGWNINKLL